MNSSVATLPRLSWSQISTYTQCPAKWWLSRHYPPERTPSALKFGSAIHRSVETFYRARMAGHDTSMDEVLAAYLDAWEAPEEAPVHFNEDETPESLRAMAERMLGAFLEAVRPGKILAIEESFAVEPVEGILVTGIVDLVEVKDGRVWIVDAKTGKNSPSDSFDKEQIGLYRLGLEELGLIPEGMPVGLRYDVLRKLKSMGEFVSVEVETTRKELADLRQKLGTIWRAMDSGIVFRSRSWACDGCQWSKACAEVDLAELVRAECP
jgi:RecB family exonuclease